MVARKLRTAAICKAPSSGLRENFHGNVFHSSKIPKKIGPGLAPLLIFVGVMGHRWYLCGSGCCISPGVNIKNIWNHLATKRSPFFQKKRPNSLNVFVGGKQKKVDRKKNVGILQKCFTAVEEKGWQEKIETITTPSGTVLPLQSHQLSKKAIWKRSPRYFGSSKKVSQKKQPKNPIHPPFISAISRVSLPFCDLGTSPGWEANMAKPWGSTGPGKLDPKIGGSWTWWFLVATEGS